jgi:outer membrane protein assembly factor BamA
VNLARASVLLALIAFGAAPAARQGALVTTGAVSAIEVTGTARLNQDQIVALSGLTTGRAIATADLDAAVKKLLDTGLLTAVHYRLQSDRSGVRVTLEVVEPLWTMAVLLDNFIWFSDEEIFRTIAREIPTFDGAVPDTEGALNTVGRVLQRMLDERQIAGTVEHKLSIQLDVGRQKQRFTVTGIKMPVCGIQFPHAAPANEVELLKAANFVAGEQYSRERLFRTIERSLVPVYKERGYLEGQFHVPQVIRRTTATCDGVGISIEVDEGDVYSLGAVEWTGNAVFSTSALNSAFAAKAVKIGERANTVKLGSGLTSVRDLYLRKGYLDLAASPTLRLDRDGRLVTYHVEITEGQPYVMGALTTGELAASDAARIIKAWPIKEGAPFDLLSAKDFPVKATLMGLVPARLTLSMQMTPLAEKHVVAVKLIARPKPGR